MLLLPDEVRPPDNRHGPPGKGNGPDTTPARCTSAKSPDKDYGAHPLFTIAGAGDKSRLPGPLASCPLLTAAASSAD